MMSIRLDGRLEREQVAHLDDHLATCLTCQARWDRMQALDALLASAPTIQAPLRVRVQVATRLSRRDQARRAIVGATALTLGTVALALTVLAPVALGLLEAAGMAPALVSGGRATLSQLSLFYSAASRTLAALGRTLALPVALVSLCGFGLATVLNGLWIGAVRYLRARR
jgi:predicted anti-sigma-YlaC factor YlaD